MNEQKLAGSAMGMMKRAIEGLIAPKASKQGMNDSPPLAGSYASLQELNTIHAERRRLVALRATQIGAKDRLQAKLLELDSQRIALLTEAIANDDKAARDQASAMADQLAELQRQANDSSRIAENLAEKIAEVDKRFEAVKRGYLVDLGSFLNGLFAELGVEYDRQAHELAETVFQLGAIQEVMMAFKTGNSNGFSRRVFLPTVTPGSTKPALPIIDGDSASFLDGTGRHVALIKEQLAAAGFKHRFD